MLREYEFVDAFPGVVYPVTTRAADVPRIAVAGLRTSFDEFNVRTYHEILVRGYLSLAQGTEDYFIGFCGELVCYQRFCAAVSEEDRTEGTDEGERRGGHSFSVVGRLSDISAVYLCSYSTE
jgi:hypothetical protein